MLSSRLKALVMPTTHGNERVHGLGDSSEWGDTPKPPHRHRPRLRTRVEARGSGPAKVVSIKPTRASNTPSPRKAANWPSPLGGGSTTFPTTTTRANETTIAAPPRLLRQVSHSEPAAPDRAVRQLWFHSLSLWS